MSIIPASFSDKWSEAKMTFPDIRKLAHKRNLAFKFLQ